MVSFCELTSFCFLLVFTLFKLIYAFNEAQGIKADIKLANEDNHHENTSDSTSSSALTRHRSSRTIFHEDQDVLILLMVVFPYYFPLWDRFINTSDNSGFEAAVAEFPTIPQGGLPACTICKRSVQVEDYQSQQEEIYVRPPGYKRQPRFFYSMDAQIVYFIIELICAYPLPIIPNPYSHVNKLPYALERIKNLRDKAARFRDKIRPLNRGEMPFLRRKKRTESTGSARRNASRKGRSVCIRGNNRFINSKSENEVCVRSNHELGVALEEVEEAAFNNKDGLPTLRINPSTAIASGGCHLLDWFLAHKVNFIFRTFIIEMVRVSCGSRRSFEDLINGEENKDNQDLIFKFFSIFPFKMALSFVDSIVSKFCRCVTKRMQNGMMS